MPRKETAKDAFLLLDINKIILKELSLRMGKAANFRNRVVHGYNNFDYSLIYKDYRKDVADLRNFGLEILTYLNKSQ